MLRAALDKVLDTVEPREALRPNAIAVVRPDDVHGLFSTEPDLAGGFTNIAPYVRDDDRNVDVLVYWREFERIPQRATGSGDDLFGLVDADVPLEWPSRLARPTRIDTSRKAFAGRGTFNWELRTYSPEEPSWGAIAEELLGPNWREDLVTAEAVPQSELRNLGSV